MPQCLFYSAWLPASVLTCSSQQTMTKSHGGITCVQGMGVLECLKLPSAQVQNKGAQSDTITAVPLNGLESFRVTREWSEPTGLLDAICSNLHVNPEEASVPVPVYLYPAPKQHVQLEKS